MARTCPACGEKSSGRFCSNCGANLESGAGCAECGAKLPPGGRFCNQCGTPTAATRAAMAEAPAARPLPRNFPLIVGGLAVTAVLAFFVLSGGDDEPVAGSTAAAPVAGAMNPAGVDLSSMTPREAADRLHDRVMTSTEAGDTTQALTFLPMAIAAYQQVPDLDLDGRYHLGTLLLMSGDVDAARAQADSILAAVPDHLFGLSNAARAELARGDNGAARALYARFLAAYDAETAAGRPEYQLHPEVLVVMRQDANRVVDSM